MKWYLDCYCHPSIGYDIPVNSYYHDDLSLLVIAAQKLLETNISGIQEVRISNTTRGLSPILLDLKRWNSSSF
ncbi:hypothetical protein C4577_04970 [Candidatus Parcubacteria bacterium]|nr:MAG: hypothetical protein C4577_04970 [Candidatus Parcubacteria bacterium]